MDVFLSSLKAHYPGKKIEKGYTWNTARIEGNVAKLIPVNSDDPSDIERAKTSFQNEKTIYSMLPSWWGIRLIDSYEDGTIFVIMTNEYKNCKWRSFMNRDKNSILADIQRQLNWLRSKKILHNDLELKNILLSCDGKHAVIIDFEKSKMNASESEMKAERDRILQELQNELKEIRVRSRSVGAKRRKRITRRKRIE
jgi:serine/threonine protein kinase